MQSPITGYHLDTVNDWVAELACGHFQHVRHNPPWVSRPWVTSEDGRKSMLGHNCHAKNVIWVRLEIVLSDVRIRIFG